MSELDGNTPPLAKSATLDSEARARFLGSELAAVLYCDEILDGAGDFYDIDRTVSVSGQGPRTEADSYYGIQQELFPELLPQLKGRDNG